MAGRNSQHLPLWQFTKKHTRRKHFMGNFLLFTAILFTLCLQAFYSTHNKHLITRQGWFYFIYLTCFSFSPSPTVLLDYKLSLIILISTHSVCSLGEAPFTFLSSFLMRMDGLQSSVSFILWYLLLSVGTSDLLTTSLLSWLWCGLSLPFISVCDLDFINTLGLILIYGLFWGRFSWEYRQNILVDLWWISGFCFFFLSLVFFFPSFSGCSVHH